MARQTDERQSPAGLAGWDRLPEPLQPLPGQIGLFEYRPRVATGGQSDLFDTGRDLPGADEQEQRILWDIDS